MTRTQLYELFTALDSWILTIKYTAKHRAVGKAYSKILESYQVNHEMAIWILIINHYKNVVLEDKWGKVRTNNPKYLRDWYHDYVTEEEIWLQQQYFIQC